MEQVYILALSPQQKWVNDILVYILRWLLKKKIQKIRLLHFVGGSFGEWKGEISSMSRIIQVVESDGVGDEHYRNQWIYQLKFQLIWVLK